TGTVPLRPFVANVVRYMRLARPSAAPTAGSRVTASPRGDARPSRGRSMTTRAPREPCHAGRGLARGDDAHALPELVEGGVRPWKRPLLEGRKTIGAHARLGQGGQLVGKAQRGGERLTARDEAIDESHAHRLVARHAASGQDEIEGVTLADQAR